MTLNVYIVVFTSFLVSLYMRIGLDAARIELTPDKCIATTENYVEISCLPDDVEDTGKEITVMEITRNNDDPIVFLRHCANITYGNGLSSKFQAKGHINKEKGNSYLNLTLQNPQSEDTGIYTCVIYYLDPTGNLLQEQASSNLLVEKLDVKSLETILNRLKDKIFSLEKKNNVQNENSDSIKIRMASLEEQVRNKTKEINGLNDRVSFASAFSVTNKKSIITASGKVIVFPDVIMMLGEGYDVRSGVFTAPRTGLYAFHLTVRANSGCDFRLHLKANNDILARLKAYDTDDWEQTSISSIANLKAGDTVVAISENNGCTLYENWYTFFTGYLIKTV